MREEIAYMLVILLALVLVGVTWQTRRYLKSEARRRRGRTHQLVRRPFWPP